MPYVEVAFTVSPNIRLIAEKMLSAAHLLPYLLTAFILISSYLCEGLNAICRDHHFEKASSMMKWTAKGEHKPLVDDDSITPDAPINVPV